MKNLILKSLVVVAIVAALSSCTSGGEEKIITPLTVSENSFAAAMTGESKTITVNSPDEWRATTTGDKWITISPSSGAAGESKVKLTVKPNDSGKSRDADIIFKSGEKSASLKVSQEFGYFFNLPCATYTIGYGGGKITVGGLPERRFRIGLPVNAQSWIKVMGNVLDVSANLTDLGRTATLTITNEEINQKYEVLLIQTSKTKIANTGTKKLRDFYIKEAIAYIDANYQYDISIQDISDACGLNRSYFGRLFKETMSLSPQQFLIQYRMAKAAQLLKGSRIPVAEVSIAVGYENQLHFSRAFKSVFDISPSEYRRKHYIDIE